MARCQHCGEPVADGQEICYACGQKARTRAYRAEHHVNPVVIIAACLAVILVLGGLWFIRANAAKKQAALHAEEETLRVQDSARRATRQWQDALRVARNDNEARSLAAKLDDAEARFQSIRLRVAEHPSVQQESIINRFQAELELLRRTVVVLASSADTEKQPLRDSIEAGKRQVEALMKELGSTE
jgi:type II secretory pathway pseudopilin PulG